MGRLRVLSGKELFAILRSFGFEVHDRRGSHIKLRRVGLRGTKETLVVPDHDELDKGTLQAIFRQACDSSAPPSCATTSTTTSSGGWVGEGGAHSPSFQNQPPMVELTGTDSLTVGAA